MTLMPPALASRFFTTGATWEAPKLTEAVVNTGRRGRSVWASNISRSSRRMCDVNETLMVGWVWTAGSDGPGFKVSEGKGNVLEE